MIDRRVRGTATGPTIIGTIAVSVTSLTALADMSTDGYQWEQLFMFVLGVAWFVRAASMGVWVNNARVLHISWFRIYRIPLRNIERVDIDGYSGALNGFGKSNVDPFWRFLRMIVLTTCDGRETEYPGTISSQTTVERIRMQIRVALGDGNA
jgi:hypothetical protein